jgi:hypothetical protein
MTTQITTRAQQKLAHAMTMFEYWKKQARIFKDKSQFRASKKCISSAKFWASAVNEYIFEVKKERGEL